MSTELGIGMETNTEQIQQPISHMTNNRLYEKIWMVNHIPAIQGIGGVQDLIKTFAYRDDLYMEKAKEFAARFWEVLYDIQHICTKDNPKNKYYYNSETNIWSSNIWSYYTRKILYDNIMFDSEICSICGDYIYTTTRVFLYMRFSTKYATPTIKYPQCKCIDLYVTIT